MRWRFKDILYIGIGVLIAILIKCTIHILKVNAKYNFLEPEHIGTERYS